jgi:hypothetical protein
LRTVRNVGRHRARARTKLSDNVENLVGTGNAQALTGNKLANTITAGGANDTLTGGGYDTYKLGAGMGHAVVNNLNADGVTTAMARSTSAPALPARISGSCAAATISRST